MHRFPAYIILLCVAATVNAAQFTCPTLEPSANPNLVTSTEPICISAQAKYDLVRAEAQTEVLDEGPQTSELDPIVAGLLGGASDADALQAYVISVGVLAILPLLCCIGNGCCGGWHVFARVIAEVLCPTCCCCAPCMCRPRTTKPYEKVTKLYPILLWTWFCFATFVCAIYGTAGGTGQFQNTFVRGSCLVDNTRLKVTTFIDQFRTPVVGFKDAFGKISTFVANTVGSTDPIDTAINDLVLAYADVAETADQSTYQYSSTYSPEPDANENGIADDHAVGCDIPLLTVLDLTTKASDAAKLSGTDFKDTMAGIAKDVKDTLVGMKDEITSTIDSAAKLIDDLRSQVDKTMQSAATSLLAQAKELDSNPNIMSSISFGAFNWIFLSVLVFSVGFVLILLNSHKHEVQAGQIHSNPKLEGKVLDVGHVGACGARIGAMSWCCVFLFGAVASGMGAAFYPISKVYGDVCIVVDDLPLKLGAMMSGGSAAASSRMLNHLSLDDASQRSLDSFLHFRDVSMSSHAHVASDRAGQRHLEEAGGMNVNNILTTCWNDGSIYDALDLAKSIPINASKMFSGFDTVASNGDLGPESKNALDDLAAEIQNMEYCPVARTQLLAKIEIVKTKTDDLQKEIKEYKATLTTIQTTAVNVLDGQMSLIQCVKCGFIKVVWKDTYEVVCKQAYSAIVVFAECMVAIGFFAFFVAFLQLLVLRRWGGHGPIKAHEHGDDGLQLVITEKLEGMCGCMSHHRKKGEPTQPTYEMTDQETTNNYTQEVEVAAQYNTEAYSVADNDEVQGELI